MTMSIQGNFISIAIPENEGQPDIIQLPDGYSYENVFIILASNIYFHSYIDVSTNEHLTFPPVKSKSPCYLKPRIKDITKEAKLKFLITKFGQIPDLHYFDNAFDPILVTGDDENEYNVIPSDQFK